MIEIKQDNVKQDKRKIKDHKITCSSCGAVRQVTRSLYNQTVTNKGWNPLCDDCKKQRKNDKFSEFMKTREK